MKMTGTVEGAVTYCDHKIEYTANVTGNYWEDPGDRWTPPSSDSEGPFFEDIDEVFIEDMEGWCEWYDQHSEEIDKLIKEDVEEHKDWESCDWDEPEPYEPEPPEEDD